MEGAPARGVSGGGGLRFAARGGHSRTCTTSSLPRTACARPRAGPRPDRFLHGSDTASIVSRSTWVPPPVSMAADEFGRQGVGLTIEHQPGAGGFSAGPRRAELRPGRRAAAANAGGPCHGGGFATAGVGCGVVSGPIGRGRLRIGWFDQVGVVGGRRRSAPARIVVASSSSGPRPRGRFSAGVNNATLPSGSRSRACSAPARAFDAFAGAVSGHVRFTTQ